MINDWQPQRKFDGRLAAFNELLDPECRIEVRGTGWDEIIHDALYQWRQLCPTVAIAQIKEKIGRLRIYPASGHLKHEAVQQIARLAEKRSMVTCELCGAPGQRRELHAVPTLCDACAAEWQ